MGMDFTDSFIILEKDKSKWGASKDKKELLARSRRASLRFRASPAPSVGLAELRTNELMTGIREDVAVKVYGENLDTLNAIGHRLEHLIASIPGARDVAMERTSGLRRSPLAITATSWHEYGMDVERLNQYISTAFAGGMAGRSSKARSASRSCFSSPRCQQNGHR